jgi:hypothetical protein
LLAFVTPNRESFLIGARRMVSKPVADRLLDRLYGRKEEDVFEVYYRANTQRDLRALAYASGLYVDFLTQNADPSYTSFNETSYRLSRWFTRGARSLGRPHLIGVFRKQA